MSFYSSGREFEETVFGECFWKKNWLTYTTRKVCIKEIVEGGQSNSDTAQFIREKVQGRIKRKIKVYSSLKSPFDLWHGVDGFFICEGYIVTIDATINRKKIIKKANLFLRQSDIEDPYRIISKIVKLFREKIKRGEEQIKKRSQKR